ncbi:hypothetical protein BTA51_08875 [Hahella sp. CCB-MM4]|uniref:hypothetical protein n=1 Tax=Hahella sp. (strain CCB-MM4) TaxID=1926491 RepID=UPI000B9C5952|nr:hypothetical protein [Hahella sp. CCB-MM4]OZG73889.1 hypothetical protein BTA51_08875 [Hahella sp. CCB-MM4]
MKKTKILQQAFCGLLFMFAGWMAHAEVALTEEVVDRWIKSQEAIMKWGEEHQEALDDLDHDGFPADVAEFVAPLKKSGLYSEAEDVLEEYGFDTPEDWAGVTLRIMHAMGAVQMEAQASNFDAQAQIDQIKNDPNIPKEQKDAMLKMMEEGLAMMERAKNAPKADVEAIRPQVGKLMEFFNSQGQ